MPYKFARFEQAPLVTRKQAELDAVEKGIQGLVIGVAAGLVIGTAVAMLLAPKSGKETRQGIKDAGSNAFCGVKEKTGDAAVKFKDGASNIGEKMKTKFASLKPNCCEDDIVICECDCCCDMEDETEEIVETTKEEQEDK